MRSHRRCVPRHQAGWSGKCILEDDPTTGWIECRLLDISAIGVAIEVQGSVPSDVIGKRITVDVRPPPSGAFAVHMMGEVRATGPGSTTGPGSSDGVRVGIGFVGLTDSERSILAALETMRMAR